MYVLTTAVAVLCSRLLILPYSQRLLLSSLGSELPNRPAPGQVGTKANGTTAGGVHSTAAAAGASSCSDAAAGKPAHPADGMEGLTDAAATLRFGRDDRLMEVGHVCVEAVVAALCSLKGQEHCLVELFHMLIKAGSTTNSSREPGSRQGFC